VTTISIGVDRAWRVFATDKGGNRDLDGGTAITWDARIHDSPGWVTKFKVTFKDSATGNPTWPFTKKINGEDAPDNHFEVLELTLGMPKTFVTRNDGLKTVKYDVAADGDPPSPPSPPGSPGPPDKVLALDPTIIIRPNKVVEASHQATDGVLFGVTCAVVGAAAGALLTALWT